MDLGKHLDLAESRLDVAATVDLMREIAAAESGGDFAAFRASSDLVAEHYRHAGLEAEVMGFPCDGEACWQMWTSPVGYRTGGFSCRIHPDRGGELSFSKDAKTLIPFMGSGFTGPEGVGGEVVEIATPADLDDARLSGKVAFTRSLNPAAVRGHLVARGALAVLSAYADRRDPDGRHIKWVNAWDAESDGWMTTRAAARQNLPGASISPADGERLHALLAQGIGLRATIVSAGAYEATSELPAVHASLAGDMREDILLTGHLFEPGLIDNASGVAIGLSAARILAALRLDGPASPPRRGIRAFHSQECYGVLALKSLRPDLLDGTFAHLNLDMVGCAGLPVNLHRGLGASTGFAPRLLGLFLERALHRYGIPLRDNQEFEINCSVLAEPALGGIPTSLIAQENPQWHTSGDRYGTVALDEDLVGAVTVGVAAWLHALATAGETEMKWLMTLILEDACAGAGKALDGQAFLEMRKMETRSLAVLLPESERASFRRRADTEFAALSRHLPTLREVLPVGTPEDIARSRELFPRAVLGGPATDRFLTPDQRQRLGSPKWSNTHLVLKAWADGTRSIHDIARFAIVELGEAQARKLTLPWLIDFFEAYAQQGIVKI